MMFLQIIDSLLYSKLSLLNHLIKLKKITQVKDEKCFQVAFQKTLDEKVTRPLTGREIYYFLAGKKSSMENFRDIDSEK